MARRSRRHSRPSKRETNVIRSHSPVRLSRPVSHRVVLTSHSIPLTTFEDRRTFHPAPHIRPAFSTFRPSARVVARNPVAPAHRHPFQTKAVLGFAQPRDVMVCVRRKQRKEVIFALNKTGKGARAREHRWTDHSNTSCKR